MKECKWLILQFIPFVCAKDLQKQWTINKCMSFLMEKHFVDYKPQKKDWTKSMYLDRFLYVDPYSWIEIEFESKPLEGIFRVLFYNLIFY